MMTSLLALSLFTTEAQADSFEFRKSSDAAATRGLLLPSAETLNKGEFSISSIEILFASASYGITDNVTMSFSSIIPILPGLIPFMGLLSAKFKLVSNPRFMFAVQPSIFVFPQMAGAGIIGVQLTSDFALTEDGKWLLTLAANPQFIYADVDTGGSSDVDGVDDGLQIAQGAGGLLGAGIQGRVHNRVNVMAEVFLPGSIAFESGDFALVDELTMLNAGVRFPNKNVTFDISLVRPLLSTDFTVLGIPFVSATGRFQ
ncbi:MAG: hypothetical protein VX278_14685 [Myxococcota bacterium]|nr:hypothetical protein [Myxococcota bacterium]